MPDGRPLRVLIKSPFSDYSGYGRDGFGLARALSRWGCDVYLQPTWLDVPVPRDLLPLLAKELRAPFDLLINHWDPANLFITPEARQCARVAVAWCVSEDVEIFTRRGWLRHEEIQKGDQALGIDPLSGLSEWQDIWDVYRSGVACHEMVRLKCPGHESLTNPMHRWLVEDADDRLVWRTSEELQPGHQIIRSAYCSQLPMAPKYSDAFVELVAWTYTEGWLERGRSVRIGQNARVNPEKTQRIRAALLSLCGPAQAAGKPTLCQLCGSSGKDAQGRVTRARGLCHTCYERERGGSRLDQWGGYETWTEALPKSDGMVIFSISRPVSQEILAACPSKVPSMEFLLALTPAQLDLFIRVSLWADGHKGTFSQARGPRLDAFVSACVLAGRPVSRPHKTAHPHLATVTLSNRRTAVLSGKSKSREMYEGVIWCPSVEFGNWLARHDGHVFYTGNTMWEFAGGPGKDGKGVSGLVPHCERRASLRKRLRWYDLVLGYDPVSLDALEPYLPRGVHRGVLQGGYDAGEWKKSERDWFGERFGFIMHGALNDRKQPWTAIQAFNELKFEKGAEFDGATLALHTNMPGKLFPELNVPFREQKIRVFVDAFDRATLDEFYAAGHCLLSPSRGEGKNLPALEFMTTGGVVAATNFGGHTMWMNGDYAYPLDYTLAPTFEDKPWAAHDARVSIEHLKQVIWHVYTNRGEARQKGELAAQVIPKMCDWPVVVESLFRRIGDQVAGPGPEVAAQAFACRRPAEPAAPPWMRQ